VAQFSIGSGFCFSVHVYENVAILGELVFIEQFIGAREVGGAYDIDHGRGLDELGVAERGTRENSQELFKLRAVTAFNGVVTAVVGPWCNLIDQDILVVG